MSPTSIIGIILVFLLVYGIPFGESYIPFKPELRGLVQDYYGFILFLVALWIIRDAIKELFAGFGKAAQTIVDVILWVFSAFWFLMLVFPAILLSTGWFGPYAHWLWDWHMDKAVLLIFVAMAYAIHTWKEPKKIVRYLLIISVFLGSISIIGMVVLDHWMFDTYELRVDLRPPSTAMYVFNKRVDVKKGDKISFYVRGAAKALVPDPTDPTKNIEKQYPPGGDENEPVAYGSWWRRRGEMEFLVYKDRVSAPVSVPIQITQEGIKEVLGYDVGSLFGAYALYGRATIQADGILSVGFFQLTPESGNLKLIVRRNIQETLPVRILSVGWTAKLLVYVLVMAVVAGIGSYVWVVLKDKPQVAKVAIWALVMIVIILHAGVMWLYSAEILTALRDAITNPGNNLGTIAAVLLGVFAIVSLILLFASSPASATAVTTVSSGIGGRFGWLLWLILLVAAITGLMYVHENSATLSPEVVKVTYIGGSVLALTAALALFLPLIGWLNRNDYFVPLFVTLAAAGIIWVMWDRVGKPSASTGGIPTNPVMESPDSQPASPTTARASSAGQAPKDYFLGLEKDRAAILYSFDPEKTSFKPSPWFEVPSKCHKGTLRAYARGYFLEDEIVLQRIDSPTQPKLIYSFVERGTTSRKRPWEDDARVVETIKLIDDFGSILRDEGGWFRILSSNPGTLVLECVYY